MQSRILPDGDIQVTMTVDEASELHGALNHGQDLTPVHERFRDELESCLDLVVEEEYEDEYEDWDDDEEDEDESSDEDED